MLEKHGWSVFGKRRLYLLQGDFGLEKVSLREDPKAQPIIWIRIPQPETRRLHDLQTFEFAAVSAQCVTLGSRSPRGNLDRQHFTPQSPRFRVQTAGELPGERHGGFRSSPGRLDQRGRKRRRRLANLRDSAGKYAGQTVRLTLRKRRRNRRSRLRLEGSADSHGTRPKPAAGRDDRPLQRNARQVSRPERTRSFARNEPRCLGISGGTGQADGNEPLNLEVTSGVSWIDYHKPLNFGPADYSHFYVRCALSRSDRQFS